MCIAPDRTLPYPYIQRMALSADMLQLIAAFCGERWESEFITDRMAVHLTEEIIKKWPKCQERMSFWIGGSPRMARMTRRRPGPPTSLYHSRTHVWYMGNRIDFFVFFPSLLRQTCKLLSKSSWTPIIQEFQPDIDFVVVDGGLQFLDSSDCNSIVSRNTLQTTIQ